MSYVEGETLGERLRRDGPAPARRRDARPARGRVGARVRARTRDRPPRREAGQHPARSGHGPRARDRLRDRARRRGVGVGHRPGKDHGDGELHEPGAGGGRADRRAERHVRARRRRISRRERTTSLRGVEPPCPARAAGDRSRRRACCAPRPDCRPRSAGRSTAASRAIPPTASRTARRSPRRSRRHPRRAPRCRPHCAPGSARGTRSSFRTWGGRRSSACSRWGTSTPT